MTAGGNGVRDDVEGRIEIELVEHAPTRHRTRTAPPTPPPISPGAPPDAETPGVPGRGRLIGIAAGIGVAGLLVGWLAGNRNDGSPATAATSPVPGTTAPPASFADDPALVEPDAPTTTSRPRPRVTTTTVAPSAVVVGPIPDIDPSLIGLPYEIVTEDGRGTLQYIDLAGNSITTLDVRRGSDTGQLFVGHDWVLVPNGSASSQLVVHDGDPDPDFLSLELWSTQHAPGASTLWRADTALQSGRYGEMIEIDVTGEPTGARVPLPRQPTLVDALGSFLVSAPGGTYTVSTKGSARITTGDVAAWGRTAALVVECDESLVCGHVVVDRVSGDRRPLPNLFPDGPIDPIGWWGQGGEWVSPDGTFAFVMTLIANGGGGAVMPQAHIVDLTTGAAIPIGTDAMGWVQNVRWTDDSQFAFFIDNGDMLAWSRATGEVVRAGPDERSTTRPQVFDIRPSDGTPWVDR